PPTSTPLPTRRSSDLVLALPADGRLAEGDRVIALRHGTLRLVKPLVLQEQNGVVVADGRLQQALRVVRRRRHDHLQARGVIEPRSEEHTSELQSRENL